MSKLHDLFEAGQSVWFDFIRRDMLEDGELDALVANGIRGLTSNPTIFQKAIDGSSDYDEQFSELVTRERPIIDDYWSLVIRDIESAVCVPHLAGALPARRLERLPCLATLWPAPAISALCASGSPATNSSA